ncbi:hypothetical protein ACQ4PT_018856 [Festuca glaucescens]
MAEHGAPIQPRSRNDPAVPDIEQPEPATMQLMNSTATLKPGNSQMADQAIGSGIMQKVKGVSNSSPGSTIKADFEFLWRLRKYLLLLAVLAVSVTYNAGLSPPGGFQMDNSLHYNAVAGDPLLPVTFFRRYEAFFYCNATAFAASLVLIIFLLSRGVASKRVWLRSMQVTMILDLFSLMGSYAAGSCRAIRSSVFILVLVCAVFVYVGIHILVFITVVPKGLKELVQKFLQPILEKLRGMLNQMLSICHAPRIDGQSNGGNEQKEIEEARKFILMLATFAATITYQAGMSPPGGFWGANGHGYRPGTFVLRRHNLLRFDIFTCCNATSFVASLVTVILLLSTDLSTHGISTGALFVCVVVDLLGLIGAYAAGCSRDVATSVAVVLIIVVVLICVLVLVMFLQSKTATDWIYKEVKPAFNEFLRMLSWPWDSHQKNTEHVSRETEAEGMSNLQCCPADINLVSTGDARSAALASDLDSMSSSLTQTDGSEQAAMEVQSGGSQQVAIPMEPSSSSDSGKPTQDILRPQGLVDQNASGDPITDVDHWTMEKSSEVRFSSPCSHADSAEKHQERSCTSRNTEEVLLKKSRTYLLFLAILAVSLTYQAGLNPPGGFWTSNATDHLAGDPILHDSCHKRYLAFFYLNATAFAASLVMILMLLSRNMSNRVIERRSLQTTMITDLLALMGAFVVGSCREKTKTIYISVVIFPVVAYVCLHVLVSVLIIPGWWKECVAKRIQYVLSESPWTDNDKRAASEKDLEQRRNFLFVLAILAATITYQAGLNPPGGIWPDGSMDGKPGNPALQDSHPKHYDVFYYSNAVSFVSSVAIIILLVNRESCERGIKSYALRVCLVAGLLALLVAYSAGSCRKLKSVFYLIAIAAVVLICLVIQVLVLSSTRGALEGPLTSLRTWLQKISHLQTDAEKLLESSDEANQEINASGSAPQINEKKEKKRYKYLMLLAVLAASIAYQAGLNPPGGFWPDDTSDGYKAGNPVLKDIHSRRYMVFFVFNSISFMSSIGVIMLLLSKSVRKKKVPLQALHFIMILDLLALLTAYAAGSCRKFKTSIFVLVVVCCVVVYLLTVIIFSSGIARWLKERKVSSLLGIS